MLTLKCVLPRFCSADLEMLLFSQHWEREGAQMDSQFWMLEELKDWLGKPSPGLLAGALSDAEDC